MSAIWNNMICAVASVALTAGIVAYADPAFASTPAEAGPRVALSFDAAKAATPAGRADIQRRIRFAADQVCDTNDAGARIAETRCREQAVAGAQQQLDQRVAMDSTTAVQIAAR